MLKLDLHIHSQYSEDGTGAPSKIIKILQKKGLDGMAITDHNTVEGALKAIKVKPKDFIVIPGIEVSTKDGHMLGLNITENIPRGLTAEETIDKIIDQGGVPIVPHLYRNMSGVKKDKLKKFYTKISAIEVFNACSLPNTNLKTAKVAKEFSLGGTGGSDSHEPAYVGCGYTTVDITDDSIDSVISQINQKKTWGEGSTMPLDYRQNRMIKSVNQFFTRGFKRI